MSDRRLAKAQGPTGDVPAPICRAILRAIAGADVVYVGFPRYQRALVVDLRRGAATPPAVFVEALELMPGQRAATVQRLRPDSPPPDAFASVAWGGSMRAFAEQGVLPAILNRLPADGTRDAMAAIEQLRDVERAAAPRSRGPTG